MFAGVTGTVLIIGNLLLTDSDRAGLFPLVLLILMLVTIFQAAARRVQAAVLVEAAERR